MRLFEFCDWRRDACARVCVPRSCIHTESTTHTTHPHRQGRSNRFSSCFSIFIHLFFLIAADAGAASVSFIGMKKRMTSIPGLWKCLLHLKNQKASAQKKMPAKKRTQQKIIQLSCVLRMPSMYVILGALNSRLKSQNRPIGFSPLYARPLHVPCLPSKPKTKHNKIVNNSNQSIEKCTQPISN